MRHVKVIEVFTGEGGRLIGTIGNHVDVRADALVAAVGSRRCGFSDRAKCGRFEAGSPVSPVASYFANFDDENWRVQRRMSGSPEDGYGLMITLICEDDFLIAQEIMEEMTAAGLKAVGPARDMEEAMRAVDTYNISVAVIDLTLSDGRSGGALARDLYRRGCSIIVCSAAILPPEELSDIEHKFLLKPTPPGAIVDCVRAAIRGQLSPAE